MNTVFRLYLSSKRNISEWCWKLYEACSASYRGLFFLCKSSLLKGYPFRRVLSLGRCLGFVLFEERDVLVSLWEGEACGLGLFKLDRANLRKTSWNNAALLREWVRCPIKREVSCESLCIAAAAGFPIFFFLIICSCFLSRTLTPL